MQEAGREAELVVLVVLVVVCVHSVSSGETARIFTSPGAADQKPRDIFIRSPNPSQFTPRGRDS